MNPHDNGTTLSHYGIKGMKWGVRRYQKKDGSLTSSGKKRYSNVYDINSAYYNKRAKKLDAKAKRNSTMASLNRKAAERGSGLISKANSINANYYQKKADKLTAKAIRNKTMADLNSQASKRRGEAKAAKAYKKLSEKNAKQVSASKQAISGEETVKRLLSKS